MDQITTYLGEDRIISSLGITTEENVAAIEAGRLGVRPTSDPGLHPGEFMAGRIEDHRLERIRRDYRTEDLLFEVVEDVVLRSGIDPRSRQSGLIVASTKGNIDALRHTPRPDPRCFLHEMAGRVARKAGFTNEPVVISNACISGIAALIVARRLILEGRYTDVVVAGVDVLSEFVVSGFHSFKSVSERICRPYDSSRNGLSLGEAAAAVLLTSDPAKAKPCPIYLAGGAMTEDANHLSAPSRTGEELAQAMTQAMEEAGVTPRDIDLVNAHGTATAYNDEMESRALHVAGLDLKPLNSLKPYVGHTLGASGVVESILTAEELRRGIRFATPGFEECGVPYPVCVSPHHERADLRTALKSGSGFGGCNAAIVLSREYRGSAPEKKAACGVTASCTLEGHGDFKERIRAEYKALGRPNMRFFKMDDLEKAGYVAAEKLLGEHPVVERYGAFRVGMVLANRSASLDTDIRHQEILDLHPDEGTSPAVFVYTLPNIVAGEISIRHGIKGEGIFFVEETPQSDFSREYAERLISTGRLDAVLWGWCELLNENYHVTLNLLERI